MYSVNLLQPSSPDYQTALRLIFHPEPLGLGQPSDESLEQILDSIRLRSLRVFPVVGVFSKNGLEGASLAIQSPGCSALVFMAIPSVLKDMMAEPFGESLVMLLDQSSSGGAELHEALIVPGDVVRSRALQQAGFRCLTRLHYFRRRVAAAFRPRNQIVPLTWMTYTPDREQLFRDVIEQTYLQTHDCPELTGIRNSAQVLADHRAAGMFDPEFWSLAMRGSNPVGMVLCGRASHAEELEIVYLGVTQVARGTGVGDALVERALRLGHASSAKYLTLAVDSRNGPALQLYRRWGFLQITTREAWIATLRQQ